MNLADWKSRIESTNHRLYLIFFPWIWSPESIARNLRWLASLLCSLNVVDYVDDDDDDYDGRHNSWITITILAHREAGYSIFSTTQDELIA